MISQYNWTNFNNYMYIERATELFHSVFNSFYNECVPKRLPPMLNGPPWFTSLKQTLIKRTKSDQM